MNTNAVVASFSIVLAVCILLSVFIARPKPTVFSFFWGDQKISWGLAVSLILTSSFSLNGLLYQTWLGFSIGWWSILVQVVWCMSFAFLGFSAPRFRALLSRGTMHGVIASRFGEAAGMIAAGASLVGFAILIGWEAVVGATVLKNVSGTSESIYLVLPVALALVASLYTSMSGLRGDAWINAVQNIFKTVILLVCTCMLISSLGGVGILWSAPAARLGLAAAIAGLGGTALIANFAFSAFWQMVDMSVWQSLAATEPRHRLATVVVAAVVVFILPGLLGTVIGVALSSSPAATTLTDNTVLNGLANALAARPLLAVALFGAFAAAMLSTIDGYALASAQAATWDLLQRRRVKRLLENAPDGGDRNDHASVIRASRWILIAAGLIGSIAVMSLVFGAGISLFDIVYLVVIAQMSLVGPVWHCLRHPDGDVIGAGFLPIVLALLLGLASIVGRFAGYPDLYTWAPVVTIVASFLGTWGVAILAPRRPVAV